MAKRPRILLIDDEQQNIKLMTRILEKENAEIITADDGQKGYELAVLHKPDIVLSDVVMPVQDGFETCKRIKSNPELMFTPVVMITALDDVENRIRGITAGADDYLFKPINAAELLARVRTIMSVRIAHEALEGAHRTMGQLTEYAETVLRGFDPLKFDPRAMELQLVSQILVGPVVEWNRPAGVLVGTVSGNGSYTGRFYYITSGRVRRFFQTAVIVPSESGDRQCPIPGVEFGNFPPMATGKGLSPELSETIGRLRNYVATVNGNVAVVAVNFTENVSRFEADVLKNLSLHISFFENLTNEVKRTNDAFGYMVESLVRAAEANDEETGNHILRVNEYAMLLALEMGLPERLVDEIHKNAQMHDVGKIHISPAILRKPGPLTADEWKEMKNHPVYGAKILGDHPRLTVARNITLTHHECYDGSGYPYGLKGEEISIEGRIVMMADVYDALRCSRSYKKSFDHAKAVQIITQGDDRTMPSRFDPLVLSAFINRSAEMDFTFNRLK